MKKYCIIVISTGLVLSVIQSDSYYDGLELNGQLFKELPETETTDDLTIMKTWHLRADGTFGVHLEKPSKYHIWNLSLEQWQEPEGYLQTIQTENTTQVNQLASQKILPKYPIYLQLNLPYDFGQDSVEVQTMRIWIDSVRTLANTAKAEIALATTLEEITTIVDNFKQELAEIS